MVQDLINQIVEKAGVPADKAQQVLSVVAGFVKQKFPMVGGQIDSVLGTGGAVQSGDGDKADGDNLLGGIGSKFGI